MNANSTNSRMKAEWKKRLFVISFVAVPILNFLIFYVYLNCSAILSAFKTTTRFKTTWGVENFTRFYEEVSQPDSILREAFRNTFLTFGVQLLLFPVGLIIAYLFYKKIWGSNVIRTLFFFPTILPKTIIAAVFFRLISTEGPVAPIVGNLLGLDYVPTLLVDLRFANPTIIAHYIWLTIPGDMIIWGGSLSRIPDSVLEAAELDGVSWWQELWQLIVPLIWPTFSMKLLLSCCGIFAATGEVFLLTKGSYELGTMTLNCWMYMQVYKLNGNLQSNAINYLSAVGIMISLVAIVLSTIIRKITGKMEEVQY